LDRIGLNDSFGLHTGGKVQNEKLEKSRLERNVLDAVDLCRAGVLDTFELELGDNTNWQSIRARLLRSFGDRGLVGRIHEIMESEFKGGSLETE
jgi:hypothetical protein